LTREGVLGVKAMTEPTAKASAGALANRRLAKRLGLVAVVMFGFGYLLVPLYDVMCDVFGLNGKTSGVQATAAREVDQSRAVTVEFTASVAAGLPWEFVPLDKKLVVHPGEEHVARFRASNLAGEEIIGQAVPSVAPGLAAKHLSKTECFCFERQALAARDGREMAVRFYVDPALPKDVQTLTLSYTFFNADDTSAKKYGGVAPIAAHEHRQHDDQAHGSPG
jgi:cytochrome c oxidase assembly protein subunit 11